MDVERDAVNRIFQPGRQTSGLGKFLLAWTKVDSGAFTACITTNAGNVEGPLILTFTETGDTAPDNTDAEVQLNEGNWTLTVYEQSSTTNLNPSLADRTLWTEEVLVTNVAGSSATTYDPCDYCDCPSGDCLEYTGIFDQGPPYTTSIVDPN